MSDTDNSEFDKRVAGMKSPVNYLSPCCDSSYTSDEGIHYSCTVQVRTRKGSPVASSEKGVKQNDNKHKKCDSKQKGRSKKDKAGGSNREDDRKPSSSAKPKVRQGHSLSRSAAAATTSILMPKRDGIATKRKKDVFPDLSSFGSDDLSNFAAILSRNVSRSHTDYRKSSSASHEKVKSKKDERSNIVDDEGKPSAKPKAAAFTKSESRTTADQMPVRICQKEGCNNILTGNRIIRCEKHTRTNVSKRALRRRSRSI